MGVEFVAERQATSTQGSQALALMAFSALGSVYSAQAWATLVNTTHRIIYSDIGTSPLYVLNGIWPASGEPPSAEDVLGGVSAVVSFLRVVLAFPASTDENGLQV